MRERRHESAPLECLGMLARLSASFVMLATLDGDVRYINEAGRELFGMPPGGQARRCRFEDLFGVEGLREFREIELPALRRAGRWTGTRTLCRLDGRLVALSLTSFLLHDRAGMPTSYGCIGHDGQGERGRLQQLRQRVAEEHAVADVARDAIDHDFLETCQRAVNRVRAVLAVQTVGILRSVAQPPELSVLAAATDLEIVPDSLPPGTASHAGYTLEVGESVIVGDYAEERRFDASLALAEGSRSGMATPIHGRNEIYGVLIVHRIEPRPYSTTDVAFLEAIAGVLSQAAIRAETEEALRHLALHDVLTGLPNRTLISDRLQHALALRKNRSSGLAVLMIDLDGFKLVNDSFGHAAGDEVLITFAQRMVRLLRRGDTLGRLGGDEFVVIAEELSGQNAILELARRIVAAAEEPFRFGADESTISASVGIAFSSPELQGTNDLLRAADAAMYRAKRQRRGLALHDERRDTAENMRSRIALALRSALDQERVDVVYQPIWRIDDGTIVAFEALARWYDEAMGEIPPSMFVPLAEDLGAVDVLGQLVLRRACSAVAQLRRTIPAMRVHVNVSPRELAHPLYVSRLRDVLNETGTSADGLALELTEAVLVEDFVEASQRIARLHELGITLQLDDFGTGYSSLSYLQRLPQISALKIDRSFIRPIRAGSQAPIVVAIVSMARALGKTVIAEGVERDEQRRWLAQLGCSYGQGWLHGKPLPEAALHALVCGRPSARSPS